ncbi:Uncharacterised protein [uncultured archaeon]|nr:Uncharacterised protein [uncultured archaeon]
MGIATLAKGAFTELARDPVLFIPKLVSTTLYIPPYLVLFQSTLAAAKNPLLSASLLQNELYSFAALILLAPVWIFIDSMYPELVRQRAATGKLDFKAAALHVSRRFLKIFALSIALLVIAMVFSLPFVAFIAAGVVFGFLPLLLIGFLGAAAVALAFGVIFYFSPTSMILGKGSVSGSLKEGYSLSRQNFGFVFWLTLISFSVLLIGFYAEGALQGLGEIGFILGRYLGAILTVYIYVLNPSAYLEVSKPDKSS